MPFFSVIIPLYNKAHYIKETLQCVINQDYKDYEIIVINDGSTDNSLAIAQSFNNEKLRIINQKNMGVAIARNNAIAQAKGKYIALLDADDIWQSNHLFELNKAIQKYPNAGLYCNNYEIYYNEYTKRKAKFNFKYNSHIIIVPNYFEASIINPVAWTSAVAFSKAKFEAIGGFNKKFLTAQDLDLWIRFALKYKVVFNPTITMIYRFYVPQSLTKKEINTIRLNFVNSFLEEEDKNKSLKKYLDINRYAIAIRSKINGEMQLYKTLKEQLDRKNLNWKQNFLLHIPVSILNIAKKVHQFLMDKGIYISTYR